MKRFWKYFLIGLVLMALLPGMGAAADEGINFGDQVGYHQETGMVTFIGSAAGRPITVQAAQASGMMAADQAMAILGVYAPLFGENSPQANLQETAFMEHGSLITTRYQQTYQGIPVLGGELVMNMTAEGRLVSLTGELSPAIDLSIEPSVSARDAAQTAVIAMAKYYGGTVEGYSASDPELWIYDARLLAPSDRPQSLVWRMEVSGDGDVPVRALVLIDAQHGFLSLQFNQIDTMWSGALLGDAAAAGVLSEPESANAFNGTIPRSTYTANHGTALPGSLLCNSADPNCVGAGGDLDAVLAHRYAGNTFEFYYDYHDRNSINDAGMTIISTVHYGTNYDNAFWNGTQMVYGDYYGFARADDVVAHELTHGVTDYTSGLFYYYQAGAINESFSDLWGEFVDLTNGQGTDTAAVRWLLGEDISGLGAIRRMSNPPAFGDPDRMSSTYYYTGSGDAGGVHTNSGVNNKAVFLMVDGASFNGYVVRGLGIAKVAAIYYEAQTSLLTSGSDYLTLYYALNQACHNLVGGSKNITTADCDEVEKALLAVEMNEEPTVGFNPEAGVCPMGKTPSYYFADNFESGSGNWDVTDTIKYVTAYDGDGIPTSWTFVPWMAVAGYATSGAVDLWGINSNAAGELQTYLLSAVSLPTTTDPLYLRFNHSFDFEYSYFEGANRAWDGGILEYQVDGGAWVDANVLLVDGKGYNGTIYNWGGSNPHQGDAAFVGPSHGYVSSRYDLSAFNGHSINFRFTVATDDYVGTYYGWDIDDVQVYRCINQSAPVWPSGVTASDGTHFGFVTITWDDVPEAETYNVYRNVVLDAGTAVAIYDDLLYPVYQDTSVVGSDTYYYWVQACNYGGCSALSLADSGYAATALFSDDFESADFSAWTRVNDGGGFLFVCMQGAINGDWGACVQRGTNDKRKQLIEDMPVHHKNFAARFNFDINGLYMGEGERFRFVQAKMDSERPFFIVLNYSSGVYTIQLNTLLDNLTKVKSNWYVLTNAPHTIEVNWQTASAPGANDGFAELYIDGMLQEALIELDNDTLFVNTFRMGFTSRLVGKSISGMFYLDDVVTSNSGYIGLP